MSQSSTTPRDSTIHITVEDPCGPAASQLIRRLSEELASRYGDDGNGAFDPADVQVLGSAFVVAWLDGRPVGSDASVAGALRPLERGIGEVFAFDHHFDQMIALGLSRVPRLDV